MSVYVHVYTHVCAYMYMHAPVQYLRTCTHVSTMYVGMYVCMCVYVSICIVHYTTIVVYASLSLPSQSGLSSGSADMVVEALSARYLDWSNQIGGIKRARAVYRRSVGSCKLTNNIYGSQ